MRILYIAGPYSAPTREGVAAMLRRCDGLALLPRWHESRGARAERAEANRLKMPIFLMTADLPEIVRFGSSKVTAAPSR